MATSKKSAGKSSAKKAAPAKKAAAKSSAKSAGKSTAKSTAKSGAKSAGKSAAKGAAKSGAAKAARKPNAAFMKPMQPSAELGAVVGTQPQPRSEITKKVWAYIKKQGLQDSKNRRMINADDKLGPVFGGKKQVSMFEMTKLVNKHLK